MNYGLFGARSLYVRRGGRVSRCRPDPAAGRCEGTNIDPVSSDGRDDAADPVAGLPFPRPSRSMQAPRFDDHARNLLSVFCFAIAEQARADSSRCDLYGSATDGKLRCHICGESKIAIFAFTLYCNVYVNAATACRTGFPFCRGYRRLKPK